MKKLFALMLALAMMLTVVCAFAENEGGEGGGETGQTTTTSTASEPSITIESASNEDDAQTDTTVYTWYRILDANIGTDPVSTDSVQTGGAVSYHTNSAEQAEALEATGLFTFDGSDILYASLVNPNTTGAQVAEALSHVDLTLFPSGTFAQSAVGKSATAENLEPGYYYIVSTAGMNAVVQTLTAVTIEEKNTFPTIEKEVEKADENAQIGDEITFTLTVTVPASANDKIVLTDTMSAGLAFKSIDSMKIGGDDGIDVTASEYTLATTTDGFTLTIPKDIVGVAATKAAQSSAKTADIVIICTAILDGDAQTAEAETNSLVLDYGDHYTTKPQTAKVKTYEFQFDKIDGNAEEKILLPGAEFNFLLGETPMKLVEVTPGEVYRIAMPDEEGTLTITTTGKTVTIYGLDSDVQDYKLQETKAPAGGYNIMPEPVPVKAGTNGFDKKEVKNFEGAVLPSTGGSGTTIFYVIGGLLIIGAGVVLVARRKAHE